MGRLQAARQLLELAQAIRAKHKLQFKQIATTYIRILLLSYHNEPAIHRVEFLACSSGVGSCSDGALRMALGPEPGNPLSWRSASQAS